MATPKSKSADRVKRVADRLAKFDESTCVAGVVPTLGLILMKCPRPCTRCRRLAAELTAPSIFASASEPAPKPSTPPTSPPSGYADDDLP